MACGMRHNRYNPQSDVEEIAYQAVEELSRVIDRARRRMERINWGRMGEAYTQEILKEKLIGIIKYYFEESYE